MVMCEENPSTRKSKQVRRIRFVYEIRTHPIPNDHHHMSIRTGRERKTKCPQIER